VHGNHKNWNAASPLARGIKGCLIALIIAACTWCFAEWLQAFLPTTHNGLHTSRFIAEFKQSENQAESGTSLRVMERSIERYTNEERIKKGLAPLEASSALAFLARGQSRNMCLVGRLMHESDRFPPGWKKFEQRLKQAGITSGGENIAYQTATKRPEKWARLVIQGWMNSPEHRKNILNPSYRYLGVGVNLCSNRIVFATQVFSSEIGKISE